MNKKSFLLRAPSLVFDDARRAALSENRSLNDWITQTILFASDPLNESEIHPPYRNIANQFHREMKAMILTAEPYNTLLIIVKPSVTISSRLYRAYERLEFNKIKSVRFIHLVGSPNLDQLPFWCNLAIDCKILFDDDGSFKRILKDLRLKMADGLMSRRELHGHYVWSKNVR